MDRGQGRSAATEGGRLESELGSVEFREGCMVIAPAAERSVGLEELHRLFSLKQGRYGGEPVYFVYDNASGVAADYDAMSRIDRLCAENAVPLVLVIDPSPRARLNIAIAHLLSKASCFRIVESLEAAFAYVEGNPLR